MYFWNTRQLALDLREGKVTEQDQMWYLFAYLALTALGTLLPKWVGSEYDMSKTASTVSLGVTVIGLLVCYQANKRGDARDFVIRFLCMSWPLTWRVLAVSVPVALMFGLVVIAVRPEYLDPFADGVAVLAEVAYFALIRRWLIRISSTGIEAATSTQ